MPLRSVILVALGLATACGALHPSGPSDVAQGVYYAAGSPDFDRFFIALHDKQVQLLAAPDEAREARADLTRAAGLTPDASDASVSEGLRRAAGELAARGLRVRLEAPDASAALDASATLYASDSTTPTALRSELPQALTRLVRSRNRMLAAKAELEALRTSGITLEGSVDDTFRVAGPWKRGEVRQNLEDAQKVITLMLGRADGIAAGDAKLIELATSAVTTDPELGRERQSAPVQDEPSRRNRRPPPSRSASPSPTKAGSKAQRAAAPVKRGGDDEGAPAPKATQGSAPAEIEP